MRKFGKRLSAVLLCLLVLALACPTATFAAGKINTGASVDLTIHFKDGSKNIPGADFRVYKVADVDTYVRMSLTTDFEGYRDTVSGMEDLDHVSREQWLQMASTLKGYVERDELSYDAAGITGSDGTLPVGGMPVGLYLVLGDSAKVGTTTYTPVPFMVFLPERDPVTDEWNYDVTAVPKYTKRTTPTGGGGDKDITRKVLKKWDDSGHAAERPSEITVQLLKDGKVRDTQVLSDKNNWRYTWEGLDPDYDWDVVEEEVDGYRVSITRDGTTFVVTNSYFVGLPPFTPDVPPENPPVNPPTDPPTDPTVNPPTNPPVNPAPPKLPQTGALWWPVPLLFGAGFLCIFMGLIHRRRWE